MAAAARTAGLTRQHIHPELHSAFEFAMRSDRDQIRRAVQNGDGELARLYRRGVELGFAQALQLARQISESIAREQLAQKRAPDTDEPMRYAKPASKAVLEARAKEVPAEDNRAPARDMAAVPAITKSSTAGEPKPSGVSCRAAVVAFLRDLAPGPVAAGEIERLAVASGLLGKGKPLGQSKIFRTARKSLGIKTYQKPGERAGGWIWSWPDQMIDLDRRVAKRHVLTEMAGVDQGHNKAAPYSQLIWDRRLDPERITLEQWILYEAHDKQFGEWPDVGPRPGVARCEMPAELQKTLGYTPVAPVR